VPIKRILLPVDLSQGTQLALRKSTAFAKRFDAMIDILHVVSIGVGANRREAFPSQGLINVLAQQARRELTKLVTNLWAEEVAATVMVREGQPHDVILREAHSTHANLIVMGARSHDGWFSRLFRQNTLERVIQSAPCPVMVFRAESERTGNNGFSTNDTCSMPVTLQR
jgi:nucleotide-binding universal stress UspA family protein